MTAIFVVTFVMSAVTAICKWTLSHCGDDDDDEVSGISFSSLCHRYNLRNARSLQHVLWHCFADRNECTERKNGGCWAHSTCKNTVGSYKCECVRGYKLQGSKCVG